MRRPILAAVALAIALTACLGRLERSDRTDARDSAANRVAGYAPGTNLRAESRPAAAVGLAVAVRERAPSDFPPIRPADVTPAMIIRTGQANIEVDSLEPAIALVRKLARELGGYVANTAMQTGRGQLRSATLEVKIPADRFDEGLGGLAPMGKLEAVNVSAEDVGEEFTDRGPAPLSARARSAEYASHQRARAGPRRRARRLERDSRGVQAGVEELRGSRGVVRPGARHHRPAGRARDGGVARGEAVAQSARPPHRGGLKPRYAVPLSGSARHDPHFLHSDRLARHQDGRLALLRRTVERGHIGAQDLVESREVLVELRAQLLEALRHDLAGRLRIGEAEPEPQTLEPVLEAV